MIPKIKSSYGNEANAEHNLMKYPKSIKNKLKLKKLVPSRTSKYAIEQLSLKHHHMRNNNYNSEKEVSR